MELCIRILECIAFVTMVLSSLYALYIAFIALFGFSKAKEIPQTDKEPGSTRFAVLIPARNEEAVIRQNVASLLKQNYPKESYRVFVIPNNCTDQTEMAAREAGAEILKCEGRITSKGDVLREILPKLSATGAYDAYVVFDADNRVMPDFLSEMEKAFLAGFDAAQGFRESGNPSATETSGACSVYYWLDNYFYTQSRWNLGGSALINGTGFAFSDACLQRTGGWQTVSLTEDIEYSGILAEVGTRIAWVPQAVTFDEQPEKFIQAWKQRLRWTVGMYQCVKAHTGKLLSGVGKTGRSTFMLLDMLFFYLFPATGVLGVTSCVTGIAAAVLSSAVGILPVGKMLLGVISGVVISFIVMTLVALAGVLRAGKRVKDTYKGILGFWFFAVSWAPIAIICLFRKNQKWDEIKHKNNQEIDKLALEREKATSAVERGKP